MYNITEILIRFGSNVKQLRESIPLTQAELGEKIGATKGDITNWERGKNNPQMDKLLALSEFFSVSIEDLYKKAYPFTINNSNDALEIRLLNERVEEQRVTIATQNAQIRYLLNEIEKSQATIERTSIDERTEKALGVSTKKSGRAQTI